MKSKLHAITERMIYTMNKIISKEEFSNFINTFVGQELDKLTKPFTVQGWEYKHLSGKIIEQKNNNVFVWEQIFSNAQAGSSILIKLVTRYIKTKDTMKIKSIETIETY